MPPVTLTRLLAAATRMAIEELHAELAEAGFEDLRPAHGYALNAIGDGSTTSRLASELGMTKQGAAKLVETLVDAGYVERSRHQADARARLLRLTERGRELLAAAESIQRRMESRWDAGALRAALEAVVGEGDPPLRPIW
jgi:DNA-binding MarR family transcriptional regulator